MRYLPEKKNKRKLASWNTTNCVICINCRSYLWGWFETKIDVKEHALTLFFYLSKAIVNIATMKKLLEQDLKTRSGKYSFHILPLECRGKCHLHDFFLARHLFARPPSCATFQLRDISTSRCCATSQLRDFSTARHPICGTFHLRDFSMARYPICATSHLRDNPFARLFYLMYRCPFS